VKSYKDLKSNTWQVEVTAATVKRVKGLTGVDLPALAANGWQGFGKLADDVIAFLEVMHAVLRGQAESQGVTEEQFLESHAGDVIQQAAFALQEAIVDFFPDPRQREIHRTVLLKNRQVLTEILAHDKKKLDGLSPESLAQALIASSGSVPASSESTPVPSPCGNSST
jgi:hypothetical protein